MSNETAPNARQRFARDLRRIREQRDLSIAALHEATQVPKSHIRAFENGTLDEQSRMNAVYLKAFVRAYAETLEIPPDPVVEQLDAALAGDYQNQLAVHFLEEPPTGTGHEQSPETDSAPSVDRETTPEQPGDSAEDDASAEIAEEDPSSNTKPEEPAGTAEGGKEGRGGSTPRSSASRPPSSPSRNSSLKGEESSPQSQFFDSGAPQIWDQYGGTLISAALVFLFLAVGGGVASLYFGGEEARTSSETAASADIVDRSVPPDTGVSADTAETDPASSTKSQRPPANVTLGDTLYVAVQATSAVAGMRVQQDDDLRRPYWIEEGEVQVFPFTRRIAIENQLDSLRLFLEDYPYPTTRTNEEGRIIIRRDTAEQFADTLRGTPASFPTPSDTVQIGSAPNPDSDTLAQNP